MLFNALDGMHAKDKIAMKRQMNISALQLLKVKLGLNKNLICWG